MGANEWAKQNAGYLALVGLGVTTLGFLLLPLYLRRDVDRASSAQPSSAPPSSGWPWLDL